MTTALLPAEKFDDVAQSELLSAAVRLYEAEMYDLCMGILNVLIRCNNKEAHILFGHCLSEYEHKYSLDLANKHYEIACEMGSAVGCYNLYLNYSKIDDPAAKDYLSKAVDLGWDETE